MGKLNFSGHESFQCRELWLKKGFDFVKSGKGFRDPLAVVDLGVGKNMVSAIQYWMTSFNLIDSRKELTEFADYIFGPDGKDPFLEDSATLWLLHYQLVKKEHASIYSIFFNKFRKEKPEFTRKQLISSLIRTCEEHNSPVSENSINRDVGVLFSTYLKPERSNKDYKALLSGLLVDLELFEKIDKSSGEESTWYWFINSDKEEIPIEILLFGILDNEPNATSISLNSLLTEKNSVSSIFAISSNGLVKKIRELAERYKEITYMDDAGINEIQFKDKIDKWKVLDGYYG